MSSPASELLRVDPLTGCKNFLGFLETLTDHALSNLPRDGRSREALEKARINSAHYSAAMFIELNHMRALNESQGRAYGDSVIHWMGILLREESNHEIYRVGGVEFVVLLKLDTREEHTQLVERIVGRIGREGDLFGLPDGAADLALIYFDESPTSLDTLLLKMGEAMVRVKNESASHLMIFHAGDFKIQSETSPANRWKTNSDSDVSFAVRWISLINIYQVLEMGRILDETQQDAFTDAISSLPNMKAALLNLEHTLQDSAANHKTFSIMMMDGDNIRIYNTINYAAGDQMIRDMCTVFRNNLRPNDFVGRWRSGDEFVVILPDTSCEGAKIIGERFRLAIKEASQSWPFPVTISIGVASYPIHGEDIDSLIDKVEAANKRAKDLGKDQVVIAE